jgi:isoprenylcysteine carboxyl methyltransferase (ICMT) family protein YpbQ
MDKSQPSAFEKALGFMLAGALGLWIIQQLGEGWKAQIQLEATKETINLLKE